MPKNIEQRLKTNWSPFETWRQFSAKNTAPLTVGAASLVIPNSSSADASVNTIASFRIIPFRYVKSESYDPSIA